MLKKLFLGIFFLMLFNTNAIETKSANIMAAEEGKCRITCTVYVADGFGGLIGVSASAGNIFMGCERAGRKACGKALKMIMKLQVR